MYSVQRVTVTKRKVQPRQPRTSQKVRVQFRDRSNLRYRADSKSNDGLRSGVLSNIEIVLCTPLRSTGVELIQ